MSCGLIVSLVFFVLVVLSITIWAGRTKTKKEIQEELFVQLVDKVILGMLVALLVFYIQNEISTAQKEKELREKRIQERINTATYYTRIQTEIIINERKAFLELWAKYSCVLDRIENWGYLSYDESKYSLDEYLWDFKAFFYRDALRENMSSKQKKSLGDKIDDLHKFIVKYKSNSNEGWNEFNLKRNAITKEVNLIFDEYRSVTIETIIEEYDKAEKVISNYKK